MALPKNEKSLPFLSTRFLAMVALSLGAALYLSIIRSSQPQPILALVASGFLGVGVNAALLDFLNRQFEKCEAFSSKYYRLDNALGFFTILLLLQAVAYGLIVIVKTVGILV